jgi:hypothetical protein
MFVATISCQRSGTKLLGSLLGSSGAILPTGEVFNPDLDILYSFRSFLQRAGLEKLLDLGSQGAMDAYLRELNTLKNIIHFDIMFNQIEHTCISWNDLGFPFIYKYMRARRCSVILLTRNPVDIFISNKVLEVSGVPHNYRGDEISGQSQTEVLTLQQTQLRTFSKELEQNYDLVRKTFAGYDYFYEVSYEDIENGTLPDALHSMIEDNARFFKISYDWRQFRPETTKLVKNAPSFRIEWQS